MNTTFHIWDVLLIVAVSAMATAIAYLHHPRWKAFVLTLPIPSTLAILSLNRPIDATNVLGLILLLIFTHGVRWLHYERRVPIVPAIVLSAIAYCVLGAAIARVTPASDPAFWAAAALTAAAGLFLYRTTPHREEPGHRSPLPVWIKLPIIVVVIASLVLMKNALKGFMTIFPMVGVVAAYEARFSLWTTCRQMPVLLLTLLPLLIVVRLTEPHVGIGWALAMGWAVLLAILIPLTRHHWKYSPDDDE